MNLKIIDNIDTLIKISQSEREKEMMSSIIEDLNEINQYIDTIKNLSITIIDTNEVYRTLLSNFKVMEQKILNFFEKKDSNEKSIANNEMMTIINEFENILLNIETLYNSPDIQYTEIEDLSKIISNIRIKLIDGIIPVLNLLQKDIKTEEKKKDLDSFIKEQVAKIDPSNRHHFKQIDDQPPTYDYKGYVIFLKTDMKNKPFFRLHNTDMTSKKLVDLIKYIDFVNHPSLKDGVSLRR